MKGRKAAPEVIAEIIALLLAGRGVTEIARKVKLDKATVSRIKSRLPETLKEKLTEAQRDRFGVLLADYLEENLKALRAQAKTFADEEWLKKHSPAEAAQLHEALADNAVRLLEAAEGAGSDVGDGNS